VQRVLSTREGHEEEMKIQRHNLFHMYFIVQGCHVLTIIDSGSCNNLVSSHLVEKLGLTTQQYSYPYKLQWFNNNGKIKVTKSARISFFKGSYHDTADFDVVPMQACSILLGCPWEFDNDALHHGRTNTYTIIHKDKKITLLPLSPMDIIKHANEIKNKPPTDIAKNNGIKLKRGAFLATTSATAELCDNPYAPCYTMFYQPIMSGALPAVTNLLQDFADDGMESRTTPILEGGDDKDIAKMESRTTPIREGEDDEDITTLDTPTPRSSPSCNSSPTQLPRRPRIQQTHRHYFGHSFSYDIKTGHSWMCWKGDDDAIVLDLVPAPKGPWIILCDYGKVLRHLFGPTWPCIVSGLKPKLWVPNPWPSPTLGRVLDYKHSCHRC
jgi:hypothetical protein